MSNSKRILIATAIALFVVVVFYFIMTSLNNSKFIEIKVFNKDKTKGERLKLEDITTIKILKDSINKLQLDNLNQEFKENQILTTSVIKGQIYSSSVIDGNDFEGSNGLQCVAIPVTKSNYSVAYNICKGDIVTVYYTAKNKDVAKAIAGKEKLYSSETADGMVTCRLFENIEVVAVSNSLGEKQVSTGITDVIVLLNPSDALLLANLKSLGIFDIVIN